MLPRQVFTHRNGAQLAARLPEPVAIGKWAQPAFSTAGQQDSPSLTTLLPAAKSRLASLSTSRLRKPLTTLSRSRLGFLSAVVSTAATIGVLPAAPRPRLPPWRSPPREASSTSNPARELRLPGLARRHRPHQLVLHQPGRRLPHPEPPRQLDRADPVLPLGQVVDRGEPGGQRQLGVLEHRAGGERELLLAAVALEDLARLERAEAAGAGGRAGQPLAPAHGEQRLAAGRLGPEALPERGLAQAPHRAPQPVRQCHPLPPPALEPARILDRTGMGVMDNQEKI